VAAGLVTVLVFVVLEYVVEPRLYNRRQCSPLLVALMLIIMGEGYGVLGVRAAPPLAAALQIFLTTLLAPASTATDQPAAEQFVALQERLSLVRAALTTAGPNASPQVLSLVERLERLLAQSALVLAPTTTDRTWVAPKVRTLSETGGGGK